MPRITPLPGRHRSRPMLLVTCVTLALALTASVSSASATTARPAIRSVDSRQVSFAGPTFATEANETVDVVGTLQVVTALAGSDQTGWILAWYTNPSNTTGTGQTTGDRYRARGPDAGFVLIPPGPQVRAAVFEPTFNLYPFGTGVHPPSPCRLLINVLFDESGRVSDVGVSVGHGVIGPAD